MKNKVILLCVAAGVCLSGCGRAHITKPPKTKEDSGVMAEQTVENHMHATKQEKVNSVPDYPEYEDAESLVAGSDAVFSGTVLGVTEEDLNITKDQDAEKLPYFIFEVKIDTLYQGEITENVIKIKHFNHGTENGALAIEAGNQYLFLVKLFDDAYPSLINANQSFFEMNTEQNKGLRRKGAEKEIQDQKISLQDILSIVAQ